MKNIKNICIWTLLGLLLVFHSCTDEFKDEQYQRMISLKAEINSNLGVSPIYVRFNEGGEGIYKLPVIVSGSKTNDKNYSIKIDTDNDTLSILNKEQFGDVRTDLHYKQLGERFYEYVKPVCYIPSGTNVGLFDINFKFVDLNLVDKWVLPVTIMEDESYIPNRFKGRCKALLYLNLFNDYSGVYSATNMKVYFGTSTTSPAFQGSRELKVVDENTVFFYAGLTEEKLLQREKYKIYANFGEITSTKEDGTKVGKLTIYAENANEIDFKSLANATYEISEKMDATRPYLKRRFITLRMEYQYTDITSSSSRPINYRCEGSMLLERKINTLIPDEDQAIEW